MIDIDKKPMKREERILLAHSLMLLGKRVVPTFFNEYSPKRFKQWQYNACRQTAIVVCQYLSEIDEFKEWNIQLYESHFWDEAFGQYDHAYVYMSNPFLEQGLFVDVARVSYPCVVKWMNYLPEDLGQMFGETVGWQVKQIDRTEIDWRELMDGNDKEYYTGLPYMGVAVRIIKILKETIHKKS